MGSGSSLNYAEGHIWEENEIWENTFRELNLEQHALEKLSIIFQKMDLDHSSTIETSEFLTFLNIGESQFAHKVFSCMDFDGSGFLNFFEFAVATWNYCSLSKDALHQFAFDLYDRDGSGDISKAEMFDLCKEVFGTAWETSKSTKHLAKNIFSYSSDSECISFEDFREVARNHQTLLFPAFKLQSLLRKRVIGETYWEGLSLQRTSREADPTSRRDLIELLRTSEYQQAARYLCRESWAEERRRNHAEVVARRQKNRRKKKEAKRAAKVGETLATISKRVERDAKRKLEKREDRAARNEDDREALLFGQFDANGPRFDDDDGNMDDVKLRMELEEQGSSKGAENDSPIADIRDKQADREGCLADRLASGMTKSTPLSSDAAPGVLPSKERGVAQEISPCESNEPIREALVSQSVTFLKQQNMDVTDLIVFLEGKGMNPSEVMEALRRTGKW